MNEFFEKIKQSILGWVTVVVTFMLGFLWWCFGPQQLIPMWLLSIVIVLGYALCIVVYAFASRNRKITYVLPEVKSIRHTTNGIIFLVEKNDLFAQGAYVTVAYQDEDDEIETTLGLGYVETINTKGNMQVVFKNKNSDPVATEIISKLSDKKIYRKAVKIKPTVLKNSVEEVLLAWETF